MKRALMRKLAPVAAALLAGGLIAAGNAYAQSLGGFPIREPGAGTSVGDSHGSRGSKDGPLQIIVDANGRGPYKTISKAIEDVAEGGVVYVMHGIYNESLTIDKSVFIQGDRGPGSGVEISAPMNSDCLIFTPEQPTAHAVVANVQFAAKINSSADACISVKQGVFTLKESDVLGSGIRPAVKISGGTVMLEKNRISAGSEGIFIEQAHSLSQSFIIDNKILQNKVGVDIASGSRADVILAGNEIFDNLDSGVKSSGYGSAKLIGNKIRNNKGSGIILDKYAKLSLVRYNEIMQNSGDGIAIPFGMNGVIEDNDIVGNEGLAIFVREGLEPKITNNFMENNGGDGKKKKKRNRRRR
jgi:nitrous oxidase accessory protein NosD